MAANGIFGLVVGSVVLAAVQAGRAVLSRPN
jgi:hypothetical protein